MPDHLRHAEGGRPRHADRGREAPGQVGRRERGFRGGVRLLGALWLVNGGGQQAVGSRQTVVGFARGSLRGSSSGKRSATPGTFFPAAAAGPEKDPRVSAFGLARG